MPERNGEASPLKTGTRRQSLLAVAGAFVALLADQIAKFWAISALYRQHHSLEIVRGFFSLSYVENQGAAWGMLQGKVPFLAIFAIITLGWIVWKAPKVFFHLRCGTLITALLAGGIAGNLLDRLLRGHVVDFLDFHWKASHFPAFNIADACICAGVFLYIICQWHEDLLQRYQRDIADTPQKD